MHITQDAALIARLQNRVISICTRNHAHRTNFISTMSPDSRRFPPNRPLTFAAAFR